VGCTEGSVFHGFLEELESKGVVRKWLGLGTLDSDGFAPAAISEPRYIGVGGMGALADELARGLDIRQDTWVSPNGGIYEERGESRGWFVRESKTVQRCFDAIVIAHNGKCAERLTSKIAAHDVHMLLRARFASAATGGGPGGGRMTLNSMYSLLVELPTSVMPSASTRGGVDGAYVAHEPALRYLGCNDAKYGGGVGGRETEVWTVLSSGPFGKAHKVAQEMLEGTPAEAEVTALLLSAVERACGLREGVLGACAVRTKLQLWGAAIPMNRWDAAEYVYSASGRIGIAGDWLGPQETASTVEAAWTSGTLLAEHMASAERCQMDEGLKLGKKGARFVPVDAGGFGSAALGKSNWVDEPAERSSAAGGAAPKAVFAQRLFIHNLPYEMAEADIGADIERVTRPGAVADVRILRSADGTSRGLAKVRMATEKDAAEAVKALDGKKTGGRALRVNFEERSGGGRRGGGGRGGSGRGRGQRGGG